MTTPRRIAVVGAGPAGTALALGLLRQRYDVTVVSDRTPEEIRDGSVMSSQVTFESALEAESALGITRLLPQAPPIERMSYAVRRLDGTTEAFSTRLTNAARSVDQRVRVPLVLDEIERRGGKIVVRSASVEDLEDLARDHDLVVVSTGRGGLTSLFELDESRSPYREPQRVAALTYLRGVTPDPAGPGLRYQSVEGVGECFSTPALTVGGICDIVVVEGVPGGPLDRWDDVSTPADHLSRLQDLLAEHFPDEAARLREATLVDDRSVLHGRITPAVRRPVGVLPSGRPVLGMADVVVLNDPLTSQGANNASKSASFYLEAIGAHSGDFDADWMQRTFDNYWRGWAKWATEWTNSWLRPAAPHQQAVVAAASHDPAVAGQIVAGFDDARLFAPWWFDAEEAERFLASATATEGSRFDARDLRRALGQYATGVTVVTTVDDSGDRFGMTANSFTSVSLNPPLVLWAAAKSSPSLPAFETSTRFAVNVLASDQHHVSRQFSISGAEKFDGVRLLPGDLPLLDGAVARFVCRRLPGAAGRLDAGDHVLFIGEIESYDAPGGEPLVFHSGFYRLATKHPDL
jgi:flavin reductase (DIM6/NTAB) family NADH-FMN oxidoreductase RutF/2-polyprenyl-6-methoxyphenol hydroxylase-like FAD-dependent oxidoreductase